jgi:curved DNA-binding protein CbpA
MKIDLRALRAARAILSDPARRAKYDATGQTTEAPDPKAMAVQQEIMNFVLIVMKNRNYRNFC